VSVGRITHPRLSDLTITLVSPRGTHAVLFDRKNVTGNLLDLNYTILENFSVKTPTALVRHHCGLPAGICGRPRFLCHEVFAAC
jgi:subtilisin-like proprotein convertase family protein